MADTAQGGIERLWSDFTSGRPLTELEPICRLPQDWWYLSVLAFRRGEDELASGYAAAAHRLAPEHPVYAEASVFLSGYARGKRENVYIDPEGFSAFIRGGGNIPLYQKVSDALAELYQRYRPGRLLDIGVGDGMALLPALNDSVGSVDLLEPSMALLDTVTQELDDQGIEHKAAQGTLQDLVAGKTKFGAEPSWDLIQSTFALHNIEREARIELLSWLASHTEHLAIVEFDVTSPGGVEPDRFKSMIKRYTDGLAEYDGDGGVVAQGFLMPVMFGYFDPGVAHHEQSLDEWRVDLAQAGFTVTAMDRIYDYWWSPAYLIEATSQLGHSR